MISTIIFDLDGTILDTLTDITNAVNFTMKSFNLKTVTEDEVKSFLGNGAKALITKSLKGELDNLDEILSFYLKHYEKNSQHFTKTYVGIDDLLKEIKGKYKLAVVSNKHQEAVDKIIEKYLPNIFDCVIGERVGLPKKPAPDMLTLAIKELDSHPQAVLFIGDSEVDVQTAKNAHVDVIAVTWGFRSKEALIEETPNYIVDTTEDIKILLKGMVKDGIN